MGEDEELGSEGDNYLSCLVGSSGLYRTGIGKEGSGAGDRLWVLISKEIFASNRKHELTLEGEHDQYRDYNNKGPRVHVQQDVSFRTLTCSTIYLLRLMSFLWSS